MKTILALTTAALVLSACANGNLTPGAQNAINTSLGVAQRFCSIKGVDGKPVVVGLTQAVNPTLFMDICTVVNGFTVPAPVDAVVSVK